MKIIYIGANIGFKALQDQIKGLADIAHVEASPKSLKEALKDADGLLDASMRVRITGDMLREAKRLKIIACATTGSDHIDHKEAKKFSITIRTLKEDRDLLQQLTPAAEHSWALLMACARAIPAALSHVRSGKWKRELFPGIMLQGKRIGIIGCGRIGGWMGRYALAFGMDVYGYDPYVDPLPDGFIRKDLKALMKKSDFITVHVHLSEETKGLLSRECLKMIKGGAVVINTSRGGIIDESALLDALKSGRIAAAGLDVLQGEPDIAAHPLIEYARRHDNLIITPHCGGFSPDAVAIVCAHTAKKILHELIL